MAGPQLRLTSVTIHSGDPRALARFYAELLQHLDIAVEDLDSAQRWALDRGATLADEQPNDDVRVFFDPDGHPFCLFLDQH